MRKTVLVFASGERTYFDNDAAAAREIREMFAGYDGVSDAEIIQRVQSVESAALAADAELRKYVVGASHLEDPRR